MSERVCGALIDGVSVHWPRSVVCPAPQQFERLICGLRIEAVGRRGKFLVLTLSSCAEERGPCYLLIHLRMSGSIDVVRPSVPRSKHDQVVLRLESGKELRFHDPRKFGRVYFVEDVQQVVGKLGPEPLDPAFTSGTLSLLLKSSRRAVKSALLDQSTIAGIGNIYADEALWRARLHPLAITNRISSAKISVLHSSIRRTLREAILRQGTDNGDGVVEFGSYRPRVYGRAGKRCGRCSSVIKRIVVAQRGTSFCPRCQRLPLSARR
ncbi:MAG: bifunctional DNA-formamidopyrimidine glycosylase/DNA-(apurinic or apyrimidinic site) lyase [Deltaproteobacteria bacterium]|nr:bifunctional DNA-formamidopyrimidine glycosylase/DNA-(apurinic or apyrimidinic site) lyase [Deltaproteobacteria bacterium]